jgi:uncharacterized protein YndB with AHSA1/START domain
MIADEGYGTIAAEDAVHATIRFERRLHAPLERVWDAVSDPAALATWLAPSSVDLRVGGTIEHIFEPDNEEQRVAGTILLLEPMTTLEYEWRFPGEPDSILRYDLVADGTDTILRVTHRLLNQKQVAGYGAGWHTYLDALTAILAGEPPIDWDGRFGSVLAAYKTAGDAER